ncbi:MAG TPA: potassium transporter, partial [Candidatus Wallbacteria bacterium]|nr:potassium transporter [Candidatus Wallbacteria bacterium]
MIVAGSTGGGIKVIRLVTLLKQAVNEMKCLIHPRGVFSLKIGRFVVNNSVANAVAGFFFLYMTVLITTFVVALAGHDILTSFTTALTTVGNIGPGFGLVGPTENYSFFQGYVKWFLS